MYLYILVIKCVNICYITAEEEYEIQIKEY